MQRIPNPVSDLTIFLKVFRDIYPLLKNNSVFELDHITSAMIETNNVTSQGAIGKEALARSTRSDRSRDPLYNQSKMYAELFRTLGWIQSTTAKLKFTFSLLGIYVATSNISTAINLLKENLLGISYPNEVLDVKSEQNLRIISGILLTMNALNSITRDEMIVGPMSISDDTNASEFQRMLINLEQCRGEPKKLQKWLNFISAERKISLVTMGNYTRFPIAVLPWTGWGIKNRKSGILITEEGRKEAARILDSQDYRLEHFYNLKDELKPAFIRCSFYSFLERHGFDLSPISTSLTSDIALLKKNDIKYETILFSPFQQLSRETIKKWAPDLVVEINNIESNTVRLVDEKISKTSEKFNFLLELVETDYEEPAITDSLYIEIQEAIAQTNSSEEAARLLFNKYSSANQYIFYPLIANLLTILGFKCNASRAGQNYERADAMIIDDHFCIPIEIKSPGEETEISVKAIRQALENKIILLSRKNYPTDRATTSLAIGFKPPNDRSEVYELVKNIKAAFDINIGVIDFYSLLILVISSISTGKKVNLTQLSSLQGVIHVDPSTGN